MHLFETEIMLVGERSRDCTGCPNFAGADLADLM